ncbi:MAG TPA: Gfo/Idh/MocA family oxidoreductase [Nitrospiraceae bacterium]|nr:Gfo/Idh/MocA family oxidoreductase [Nitrospiraceae bacterium]
MGTQVVPRSRRRSSTAASEKIRYAVVGLGHIAQAAVLPAFRHARLNSVLSALVSGDRKKLVALGRRYRVPHLYTYDQYDRCLGSGLLDAVYLALPNHLHEPYAVRAARAGVHVLCEKPLALSEQECRRMIAAAARHDVKLMTAYRLHFDAANMAAVQEIAKGRIGEPRMFQSVFSLQVKPGNIRVKRRFGGGPLWDIGIYCVNAARYLFRDEPVEVFAFSASNGEARFREVEEMVSATLRFPHDRLAIFACSFGATDLSAYEVVGTKGVLRLDQAYEYALPIKQTITVNGKATSRTYPKRDQFAPQLLHFSDCILNHRQPRPSGEEGLRDVRIIRALYRSAETGRPVALAAVPDTERPSRRHVSTKPPVRKPREFRATPPSQ